MRTTVVWKEFRTLVGFYLWDVWHCWYDFLCHGHPVLPCRIRVLKRATTEIPGCGMKELSRQDFTSMKSTWEKKHCVILHSRHRKFNDYQINWSYCLGRAATIHTSLTCSIAAVFKLTPKICLIQVAFVVRARIPLACYRVYSDRVRHTRALRQGDVRVGKKAGRGCMCDRVWPWRALDAAMAPGVRECLLGMSGPAAAWRDHVYLPPRSLSLQELVMM